MTSGTLDVGPALDRLIHAQDADDDAVTFGRLREYSGRLAELCQRLEDPLVWPVGSSAERLTGAAVILSGGKMRTRGWTTPLANERVLLVTVAAVTPLGLLEAAERAKALGATEIFACGVRVEGLPADGIPQIKQFISLSALGQRS